MNKIVFAFFILIVSVVFVNAFVFPENYKGIKLKFYSEEINKTLCYKMLDKIPVEYFEGLEVVKVFPEGTSDTSTGRYIWDSDTIHLYNECILYKTMYHELAHHLQYIRGDTLDEDNRHIGRFCAFYEEILFAVDEEKSVSYYSYCSIELAFSKQIYI